MKYVSPFQLGNDGDGSPSFGTNNTLAITHSTQVPSPSAWFRVLVQNVGGQTATGVVVTDSRGALPFGQNNANAVCDAAPTTLAAGALWQCRYRVPFTSASPASNANTVSATSPDVVPDANDTATATVQVSACTGTNRTVPNVIGLNKANSQAAWTAAGFTGTLSVWGGQPNALTLAQSRPAFECVAATSTMTVSRTVTP